MDNNFLNPSKHSLFLSLPIIYQIEGDKCGIYRDVKHYFCHPKAAYLIRMVWPTMMLQDWNRNPPFSLYGTINNLQDPTSSSMSSPCVSDVWGWICSLPPVSQWDTNMSFSIYTLQSTQHSLNFSINKSFQSQSPHFSFSISANCHVPIVLWTSDRFSLKTTTDQSFDEETKLCLFFNMIKSVLKYGPNKKPTFTFPAVQIGQAFRDAFNLVFLTLAFLICIYDAPSELRLECTEALSLQLLCKDSKESLKRLVSILGSNLEEQWMRSVNLAFTNWMQGSESSTRAPSLVFSYAVSASRLWKVQLYCPTAAMRVHGPSSTTLHDEGLQLSLNYQQLEGVIQFVYNVIFRKNWIDVQVRVDNVRCDVSPLLSESLMLKRGYGSEEKHFPSRICLQLTPTIQTDILSVSVSKSTDNPEVTREKGIEGSLDPSSTLGLRVSASESVIMSMKQWKFEQSVYGNTAIFNWFLHDGVNGKEVFSSKPSAMALMQPRAWFRNRYSSAYRPFTRHGGVIFAGDEYGESVWWKVRGEAEGKSLEWEIRGWIWVSYRPNRHWSLHSETRMLEFREVLHIPLSRTD